MRVKSNWNTTRTGHKSDIQPLDGLVADDDGGEEEDNWGTAHRSKHYDVHLHPPRPQQGHHGVYHLEKKRRRGGRRREIWIQKKINRMYLTK